MQNIVSSWKRQYRQFKTQGTRLPKSLTVFLFFFSFVAKVSISCSQCKSAFPSYLRVLWINLIQYCNINIPRGIHTEGWGEFQCRFTDVHIFAFRRVSFFFFLRDIECSTYFLQKRFAEKIMLKSHHTNYTRVSNAFLFLETRSRNDYTIYTLRNILHMPTSITRKALDHVSIL